MPIVNNQVNAQSTHSQNSNNLSIDSGSTSWYQQFTINTDNGSTDNTCINKLIPNYKPGSASTSTYATNYGHLWRGHGR